MKTLMFPLIAILLIVAISASPVIPFLDEELGKTMVMGAAEEEETSNIITIKKFDETDSYLKYVTESEILPILREHPLDNMGYIFSFSDCTIEILDPPPRNLA
ncbi:hypothetical protein [Flagellimonas okinawensis]|uniref:Uncharacterized protein n=1 Tax=Flagellimonas okinawensis TaxID=3031324 RepID=A0ABT5XMG4_9FLAO|nr:hypothetical protein [[Muricauda] okinawensis]MDF0707080.1 hypothetical protein [[Muricauda] okinawensis]